MPFSFSFSFSSFFSFFVFPLPFVVLRVPLPFSFFVRFSLYFASCRFPFFSCIAFFAFLFASLLSLVANSVVLSFRLGVTSRALIASLKHAYSPCVLSFACVVDVDLFFFFFSSFPFVISI